MFAPFEASPAIPPAANPAPEARPMALTVTCAEAFSTVPPSMSPTNPPTVPFPSTSPFTLQLKILEFFAVPDSIPTWRIPLTGFPGSNVRFLTTAPSKAPKNPTSGNESFANLKFEILYPLPSMLAVNGCVTSPENSESSR